MLSVDFQNLAFHKHAVQSSTNNSKVASAALDSSATCAETGISSNPWWRVDLGGEYDVLQVIITSDPSGE